MDPEVNPESSTIQRMRQQIEDHKANYEAVRQRLEQLEADNTKLKQSLATAEEDRNKVKDTYEQFETAVRENTEKLIQSKLGKITDETLKEEVQLIIGAIPDPVNKLNVAETLVGRMTVPTIPIVNPAPVPGTKPEGSPDANPGYIKDADGHIKPDLSVLFNK